MRIRSILFAAAALACAWASGDETSAPSPETHVQAEVIVYGGTPAGIMAAIAAARQGHTVALVDLNGHVGGMVSGGLVATDIGDRKTVAGLADEFFQRIVKYYTEKYGRLSIPSWSSGRRWVSPRSDRQCCAADR